MFSTLEQFHEDYRIQNNQQPNETVLNRGILRLKREIRELKTILDLIQGKEIEEWNEAKIYEIDEYVMYEGLVYKSILDTNYDMNPKTSGFWELQTFDTIKNKNSIFEYQTIISDDNQLTFNVDFTLNSTPAVFVDGLLYDSTEFAWTSNSVTFNSPVDNKKRVTIISGISYESVAVLPKREFISLQDQYVFNTPFQLETPSVFVDGLLQTGTYFFGVDYVEFYEPLNYGQKVVITNGFQGGVDVYDKTELDEKFKQFYTKDELYTKQEVDQKIQDTSSSILNDPTLAKASQVYTKTETNNLIQNFVTNDDIQTVLDVKADKATSLEGYGITDAYTKTETDQKLDLKLDSSEFTKESILSAIYDAEGEGSGLSATTLQGLTASQFLRSDVVTQNEGGLFIYDDIQDQGVAFHLDPLNEVPETGINLRGEEFTSKYQPSFNGFNSEGLYFICEGEFKGTWWSDIREFGVPNFLDYNWIVDVSQLGTGTQFDFVPKNYGSGFLFKGFNQNKTDVNDGSYAFGFLDNKIVKMYSYVKKDDTTFLPIPAHYKLIGIKKTISTHVTRNQNDEAINYIQFNGVSNEDFENYKTQAGDIQTFEVPDVLNDNALMIQDTEITEEDSTNIFQSETKNFRTLTYKVEHESIASGESTQIIVENGFTNSNANIEINGDGSLLSSQNKFDQQGFLILEVTGTQTFSVIISSDHTNTLTIRIKVI